MYQFLVERGICSLDLTGDTNVTFVSQAAKKAKKDKDFETPKKSEEEEKSKDKVSSNDMQRTTYYYNSKI